MFKQLEKQRRITFEIEREIDSGKEDVRVVILAVTQTATGPDLLPGFSDVGMR